MKKLIVLIGVVLGILSFSCHDITVGYLSTEMQGMSRILWW